MKKLVIKEGHFKQEFSINEINDLELYLAGIMGYEDDLALDLLKDNNIDGFSSQMIYNYAGDKEKTLEINEFTEILMGLNSLKDFSEASSYLDKLCMLLKRDNDSFDYHLED